MVNIKRSHIRIHILALASLWVSLRAFPAEADIQDDRAVQFVGSIAIARHESSGGSPNRWRESSQESGQSAAGYSAANARQSAEHTVRGLTGDTSFASGAYFPQVDSPSGSIAHLVDYSQSGIYLNWGFDDMYRTGAKVSYVYGPNDDGYRLISMKAYTTKLADGSLQTFIGIVDITDPTTPYSPYMIPVTFSGSKTFPLRSGGRQYTYEIRPYSGEHNITLMRSGTREGEGWALSTSFERLMRARADQAASGTLVEIGGNEFYAMPQGGTHGSILFFPKANIDARDSLRDFNLMRPTAMADVSMVDSDGATVPVTGHPDLGVIDGEAYHLELIYGGWAVRPGAGDHN